MATAIERTAIIKLVTAMFNAAPGSVYLSELVSFFDASGGTSLQKLSAMATALGNTGAYKTINPTFQVASEFANVFLTQYGLQANQEAIDFITAKFNAGVPKGQIAFEATLALNESTAAAFADARAILNNKTSVAEYFSVTKAIAQTSVSSLQSVLANVTKEPSSVTTANTAIDNGAGATTATVFTLTTATDNLTGTSGNDVFSASVSATAGDNTLTLTDTINGGAGTDVLNVLVSVAAADIAVPSTGITNIETVNIRSITSDGIVSNAATFASVAGVTTVSSDRSTEAVTVTNLAAGATIGVIGDGSITQTTTSFAYAATGTAAIAISGGTKAGNITNTGAASATNTVSSTGAANTVGIIDLGTTAAVTALTINAATNLTASLAAGDYAAAASVTVAGAATLVNLSGATLAANITKVDASGMTAGGVSVKVDQTNTTVDTQFIGGTGADTLDVGNVVYNSATLTAAGGTGTDVIRMNDQAALTTATAARITAFETLSVYDDADGAGDTFDMSLMTTLTSVTIGAISTGNAVTISGMNAAQAAAVTISGSQAAAPVFVITGATTNLQFDTLTIAINDGAAAVAVLTLAEITAAGVETVNFALTDSLTLSGATGLGALTKMNITGSGALNLTTGSLAANANSGIDASASTGTVTIDASGTTANGLGLTGSSTKNNTITGTGQADAIVGGTAIDNVTSFGAGADTVNFQVDTAVDVYNLATLTGRATFTNFDAATSTTTEDFFNVTAAAADGGEVVVTAAATQGAFANDRTVVVEQAIGAAGALTTSSTTTLVTADFTATTLTNLAAYLGERFQQGADTIAANNVAVFVVNNGTNSYAYAFSDSATSNTTIEAGELTLVGVFTGAILLNADVQQAGV